VNCMAGEWPTGAGCGCWVGEIIMAVDVGRWTSEVVQRVDGCANVSDEWEGGSRRSEWPLPSL
jgi:hypothetical protein